MVARAQPEEHHRPRIACSQPEPNRLRNQVSRSERSGDRARCYQPRCDILLQTVGHLGDAHIGAPRADVGQVLRIDPVIDDHRVKSVDTAKKMGG